MLSFLRIEPTFSILWHRFCWRLNAAPTMHIRHKFVAEASSYIHQQRIFTTSEILWDESSRECRNKNPLIGLKFRPQLALWKQQLSSLPLSLAVNCAKSHELTHKMGCGGHELHDGLPWLAVLFKESIM